MQPAAHTPSPDPLAMPAGALMRPAARVEPEDSIRVAAARLRESGVGAVALVEGDRIVGAFTERSFLSAVGQGTDLEEACGAFAEAAESLRPYRTGSEALRQFDETGRDVLFIADDGDRVMGVLTPSDLLPRRRPPIQPHAVGGMATPFGVYLTTGSVHGGAGGWALVGTGAALFGLMLAAQALGWALAGWLLRPDSPTWALWACDTMVPVVAFLLGMRLMPLAGTHGAEHQVVHAIERGEVLVPSVVRRMPRVHPRCGTNLAVALTLFLGVSNWAFIPNGELRLLAALAVAGLTWRPIGSFLQHYVTTKPPSDRQLASGIEAGRQLIERYQTVRSAAPSIPIRIWNSGMPHVVAGTLAMYALAYAVSTAMGWGLVEL